MTSNIQSNGDIDDQSLGTQHSSPVLVDSMHSDANVTGSSFNQKAFFAHVYTLTWQLAAAKKELGKVKADLMLTTNDKNRLQKKLDDALLKLDHASANCDVSLPIKKELKDVIEAKTKSIL